MIPQRKRLAEEKTMVPQWQG